MSAALQSQDLTITAMEQALNLRGWGAWARRPDSRTRTNLGHAVQAWVFQMKEGYRVSSPLPPDIDEEYALRLDMLIARLPERHRDIVKAIYVFDRTINELSRWLHVSRVAIRQDRDAALYFLYGALKSS